MALVRAKAQFESKNVMVDGRLVPCGEKKVIDNVILLLSKLLVDVKYTTFTYTEDVYICQFMLVPDGEIVLSDIENIVKNGNGLVFNVEVLAFSDGSGMCLRVYVNRKGEDVSDYRQYMPPIEITNKIRFTSHDLARIKGFDGELVADIVESVYNMRVAMPEISFRISDNIQEETYEITFTGLESVDHAFIIFLAQKGLTFLERVIITRNNTGVPSAKYKNTLTMNLVVRKSKKASKFVYVPLSDLLHDEDDKPQRRNGKRTAEVSEYTDSEIDTKKRIIE